MSGLYFAVDGSVFTTGLFSIDGLVRLLAALTVGGLGTLLINPLFPLITLGYVSIIVIASHRLLEWSKLDKLLVGVIIGLLLLPPLFLMGADVNEVILVSVVGGLLGTFCARSSRDR